jgi:RNA polymerase sigma factor (TIGR02999 family)
MRRILVDRARKKERGRHGGGLERVDLEDVMEHVNLANEDSGEAVLAVHQTLDALAVKHPRKAKIVKLRYFTGMTLPQIALAIGFALPTVERDWAFARAWLHREIKKIFEIDDGFRRNRRTED